MSGGLFRESLGHEAAFSKSVLFQLPQRPHLYSILAPDHASDDDKAQAPVWNRATGRLRNPRAAHSLVMAVRIVSPSYEPL